MDNESPDLKEVSFEDEEIEQTEESPIEDLQKIVSYNVANTIEVLKLKIDSQEIDLKPEFQRDFVWDITRASLFIDSLILGLPIPSIFLGKSKEEDNYMVIDGQQRLKSAYYYITGKFIHNGIEALFTLKGLDKRDWNDKSYAELDEKYKRRIRNAVINTTIIEDINSKPRVIHDLFHRLNTGGMPLTDQEIRNCVYSGLFNKQLMDLNRNSLWRKLLGTEAPDKRLRDVELILRFFALLYDGPNYKPSMKIFLSDFQEVNKANDFIESNNNVFVETVNRIYNEIGPDAFKTSRSINKSMCDSIMVSIAQIIGSDKKIADLKENYKKLLDDETYVQYTQSGTSTYRNVIGRIGIARNYFLGLGDGI